MYRLSGSLGRAIYRYRFQLCVLSVAAAITFLYTSYLSTSTSMQMEIHNLIVTGQAQSPYEYRVLVPYSLNALIGPLSHLIGDQPAFTYVYSAYFWITITAFLLLCYHLFTKFHRKEAALAGVLFIAVSMDLALKNHYYQPWTLLESVLFVTALILIVDKKDSWLLPLLVVASFNRESSLFIVILYFLMRFELKGTLSSTIKENKRTLCYASVLFACWAVIYLSLRLALGPATPVITVEQVFATSTTPDALWLFVVNLTLIFGAFWLLAPLAMKKARTDIRKSLWIVPIYLVPNLLLGVWYEVRVLIPLLPIFVVIGLYYLVDEDGRAAPAEGSSS